MIFLSIQQILDATGGTLVQPGVLTEITGVSTDTRSIKSGDLFVPLIGENFDGHHFIGKALEKGAAGFLFSTGQESLPVDFPQGFAIRVSDTLAALQVLSGFYRRQFSIPLIGVTGSTGKTSTKEMITSLLNKKFRVLKNIGNLNNEIGLPLTLFQLRKEHELGVLEMGMSDFGEIQTLADLVRPHIGVISNIGMSHIEHLGSQENIMKAKMEITSYFKKGDILLVNGDDPHLSRLRGQEADYQTVTYGLAQDNDFYPSRIEGRGSAGFEVEVGWKHQSYAFQFKAPGRHQIYNLLAALWIGFYYGLTPEEIQHALDHHQPAKMRLEIHEVCGVTVINDAYNASPDSMKAALQVLNDMTEKRRIAVLGNMLEMGCFAEAGHGLVGESFSQTEIEILITVGEQANWIGTYAAKNAKSAQVIIHTANNQEAITQLKNLVKEQDAILVKGSRGMKMEEIVHYLLERS